MYGDLIRLNTQENAGPDFDSWKTDFRTIMKHFLLNLDEECFMAQDGDVKIVGGKLKSKHERNISDSRVSVTVVRIGSCGGSQGPTGFCLQGEMKRNNYSDEFLMRHGAAPGSCIEMTPTAFMTEVAWLKMSPKFAKGIRQMPFIRDHPRWWVFMSFDGFKIHVKLHEALAIYYGHLVNLAKEEADSSGLNQPFDKKVAKDDKVMMRDILSLLRTSTSITRGVVDQYGLVHVALRCVSQFGEAWETSFRWVNMHPDHRLSFKDWIKKIAPQLQSSCNFKIADNLQKFWMLPAFWIRMTPSERKVVIDTVKEHAEAFTVGCLKSLHSNCGIPYSDMQHLRVCYDKVFRCRLLFGHFNVQCRCRLHPLAWF